MNKKLILKGVTSDSRKVKEGYNFIAIKGENQDGNSLIKEKGSYFKVQNAPIALEKLNRIFDENVDKEVKIIGVTGTNGKTTTTHMIEAIFKQGKRDMAIIGGAEDICKSLYDVKEEGKKWAILEVSSHGLKEKRVEGINFDTGIFTNISIDHLDYHKDFNDYFNSKRVLFQELKNNTRAIINGDDPWAFKMVEGMKNIYIITYGLKSKSTITASSIDISQGIKFNYCLQRTLNTYRGNKILVQEFPIEMKLLGYHNIYNALAAITTAIIYEIPIDIIQRGLKDFNTVSRRLEFSQLSDYYILDDCAHNPTSFDAVFQTLQTMDYHNVHLLVAIRGNRGEEINIKNAEVLSYWCSLLNIKNIYITEYKENPNKRFKVSQKEREGFLKVLRNGGVSFKFIPGLTESIKVMLKDLEKKDFILLLGDHGMDDGKKILRNLINY